MWAELNGPSASGRTQCSRKKTDPVTFSLSALMRAAGQGCPIVAGVFWDTFQLVSELKLELRTHQTGAISEVLESDGTDSFRQTDGACERVTSHSKMLSPAPCPSGALLPFTFQISSNAHLT